MRDVRGWWQGGSPQIPTSTDTACGMDVTVGVMPGMLWVFGDAGPCMATQLTVPLLVELFVRWPLQMERF